MKGFDNLKNLKDMWLEENQIELIQGLENLSNLHTLIISDNKISQLGTSYY